MKEYTYDKRAFFIEVTITGIFSAIIMAGAIILAVLGILTPLMLAIAVIAGYSCWNTYVSKSNTETVTVDDEYISFSVYGREDKYLMKDIEQFRIREFPSSGKMYIRMNKSNAFKGRYWLQTKVFSDGKELFRSLLDIEYKLHPDTLKARARRVNTEYIEAEKSGKFSKKRRRGKRLIIKRK